ncbi:hypothetical protein [Methanobrevibacter sp.]|uniref:hypothetical protein n=1 Tax=Methanobrevibacter sp. TaxID=66852 RepID=UPI0038909984
MKKTIKLLIATTAILLVIGVVSAANPADIFKAPSGLTASGNDTFVDGQNHNIQIFNYTDELYSKWFKNDSVFSISQYKNTKFFNKNYEKHYGILEIVEKDGNKYIIDSWTPKSPNELNVLKKNLEDFNNINNLTPIAV